MARRHTLILSAIAGTIGLWGATIATALTEHGSDRLHNTLLAASFLAGATTVAMLGYIVWRQAKQAETERLAAALDAAAHSACDELHAVVVQSGDELHKAVEDLGQVLQLDRQNITMARSLMAELANSRQLEQQKPAA